MGVEKGGCMCIAGFLWLFVTSLSALSSDPRQRASAFCKSVQTIGHLTQGHNKPSL